MYISILLVEHVISFLHQGFQLVMFTFDALGVVNIRHCILFNFATLLGNFQVQFILMFIQKNIIAFLFYLCVLGVR